MCLGIPGKVVKTYREHDVLMGKIDFSGVMKQACLEHVPDVKIGEYVLVHVGFALSKIDEDEARRVFEFLDQMNQLDELHGPPGGGAEMNDERPRIDTNGHESGTKHEISR
ncbi:MAG TPA: HypC/HybG/HupF family hydrogenase formation chaperone [Tepidisphaeraceae bacterium]|nr:HypC/HybG/HupF family hydrogenase formation chaperone [Tepidisphaeraceae bacterium]